MSNIRYMTVLSHYNHKHKSHKYKNVFRSKMCPGKENHDIEVDKKKADPAIKS